MLCIELAAIVQFYVFGQKVPVAKPAPIFFLGGLRSRQKRSPEVAFVRFFKQKAQSG
ncbi:hypothetical protein DFO77_14014 [Marinilabilia salmonicolor]|uniref:Uncharacterized protein n=1 Tax=Marinilabilia salmonicolor TaxID=989 RepID=A0A368UJ41_9BACT|nr:hypothetical protein DFO77_14014 [Marinilabilia salmonicolor]